MTFTFIKNKLTNNKFVNDSFWSLIGSTIGRGLSLLSGIYIARLLGKDIFGEYGIIKNTILSIAMFSTFGLGYTATKFIAEYNKNSKEKIFPFIKYSYFITFSFCAIISFLIFLNASYISSVILKAPHLRQAIMLVAMMIIINGLTTTQIGILAGFGAFKILAKINTIIGAITFITSITFTYYFNFNGALLAIVLTQLINLILNSINIKKLLLKDCIDNYDKNTIKKIIKFSFPIAMQEAVFAGTSWICSVLIIRYSSFGELGMYNAAMQWNSLILFIPSILRNVALSHLSENIEDTTKHKKILNLNILLNLTITSFASLTVFCLSGIISNFYGSTFNGVQYLISIAVLITIFLSISNIYSQAYMSLGLNWTMFVIRLFRDGGQILLFIIIINIHSLEGAKTMILCQLILSFFTLLFMSYFYNKRVQSLFSKNELKSNTSKSNFINLRKQKSESS